MFILINLILTTRGEKKKRISFSFEDCTLENIWRNSKKKQCAAKSKEVFSFTIKINDLQERRRFNEIQPVYL